MGEQRNLGTVVVQCRMAGGTAWEDCPDAFGTSVPAAEAWMQGYYEDGWEYRWARVGPVVGVRVEMVEKRTLEPVTVPTTGG